MRVLLVVPPKEKPFRADMSDLFEEEAGLYPPLGLMYLAAYLRDQTHHEVAILDCPAEQIGYPALAKELERRAPDVVGLTALTFHLLDVVATAKLAKEVNARTHVCLGGPHAHIFPRETLAFPFVDSVVRGEGEQAFAELMAAIAGERAFETVKGCFFKRDGEVVENEPRPFIEDLDSLPFPARDLTPTSRYHSVLGRKSIAATMMTSRGCPYRCVYCHRPHLGKKFRARSARNVVDEVEDCLRMGIGELLFFDDTFTVRRERVLGICEEIAARKLKTRWSARARVDTVDEEMLVAMKNAGCVRLSFGVEAGTQKALEALGKGITLEQARTAIRLAKKVGVTALADFMMGSPGETRDDVLQTIEFALELDPHFAQFTVTTPYPETELYRRGLESGVLKQDYWRALAKDPQEGFETPVWEENLSKPELVELLRLAYKRFYSRPGYLAKSVLRVRSLAELKRKAAAGLKVLSGVRTP